MNVLKYVIATFLVVTASRLCADTLPDMMFSESGSWGINIHYPYRAEAIKQVGCQWVRLTLRWRDIEKDSRGQYTWTGSDKLLQYYKDQGFKILCVMTAERMNPLYQQDQADKEMVSTAIAQWMTACAQRYKGQGIVWELGNEPQVFPMGGYWNDPLTYTRMARQAASGIKKVDPKAIVAALSLAWVDRSYTSKALNAGLLADGTIDLLSFHGYHRKTIMAESGLADDVKWLRQSAATYAPPGKVVEVIDSECGYALMAPDKPKSWSTWRIKVYSEMEQAAYLARHYLEEIHLGLEISIWYKDMHGEEGYSLYYGDEKDKRGLRPMGRVFSNLAALLQENPKKLQNHQFPVSLVDLPDKISAPDSFMTVHSYLRSYLQNGSNKCRLVVAAWNPVEAFDGRILEKRERIKDQVIETWRPIRPDDVVEIPVQIQVANLSTWRVEKVSRYDLLADTPDSATTELQSTSENTILRTPVLNVGSVPTIVIVDMVKVGNDLP